MVEDQGYPGVYVLGAPKCGTTSLHEYLGQHPAIFVSKKKELHYFTHRLLSEAAHGPGDEFGLRTVVRDESEYLRWFRGARPDQVSVDVSPSYLYYDQVAPSIHQVRPDAQLIAVVRDPVEKAYSQYLHMRRSQRESLELRDALAAEGDRTRGGWSDLWRYVDSSRYAGHLRAWAEVFGRERLLVLFSEELAREPARTMTLVHNFIGVEPRAIRASRARNAGGLARSRRLASFIEGPNRPKRLARKMLPESVRGRLALRLVEANTGTKPHMDPEMRRELQSRFRSEVTDLADFMGSPPPWSWSRDAE